MRWRTLTTAAVIGRQFDFKLLRKLSEEFTETQLLELVDQAMDAHILQEAPDQPDRYQFSHALVQQTLLERLSTSRKVRLHALVGEALETLYEEHPQEHASELAHHFFEAAAVSGTEKLVRYSQLAGEQFLAAYAHEEALGHFQRGLIAKDLDVEGLMPVPDAEAAALLFGLGRTQAATVGRQKLDVVFTSLNRAFDFYAETHDLGHAIGVAGYPMPILPGHRVAEQLVARALQLAPPDSLEAGRLLSRYILVMGLEEGDYQGAIEAFDRAVTIAQRNGDVVLEMRILAYGSMVDFWHLQWQGTVAKGLRVVELARQAEDQLSEVSARFWAGVALLGIGDSERAQPHAAEMLSAAVRLRDRYQQATAHWFNEMASIYKGDWQAAKDSSERGLSVSPSDTRLLGTRMLTEREVGNTTEGHRYLEQLVEALRLVTPGPRYDHGSTALLIPMVARITGGVDQLRIAENAAATVLSAEYSTSLVSRLARLGLAMMAVIREDAEAAREQYVSLDLAAGCHTWISGDRVLGLLAQTMGDLNQGMAHFEDALAFCRKAGYRPELAWTCYDYAELLLQHPSLDGRKGGARTAATQQLEGVTAEALLEEGMAIAAELGMPPLMERIAALQESAAAARSLPAYPNRLTQREVEVLLKLSQGKTNREIARDLVLSERTVQRHIANIYAKIGARNRAEATTFALSQLAP